MNSYKVKNKNLWEWYT